MAKGGLTSRILTPERKLSLQVFFSNKLAVVGLIIVLAYVADALIVQFAPWLIGLKHPFEVIPDYSNPGAPAPLVEASLRDDVPRH